MSKTTTKGVRVVSSIAPSLKKKAAAKAKKNNSNLSEVIRNFLQVYAK
jgi:hypothetical protein